MVRCYWMVVVVLCRSVVGIGSNYQCRYRKYRHLGSYLRKLGSRGGPGVNNRRPGDRRDLVGLVGSLLLVVVVVGNFVVLIDYHLVGGENHYLRQHLHRNLLEDSGRNHCCSMAVYYYCFDDDERGFFLMILCYWVVVVLLCRWVLVGHGIGSNYQCRYR